LLLGIRLRGKIVGVQFRFVNLSRRSRRIVEIRRRWITTTLNGPKRWWYDKTSWTVAVGAIAFLEDPLFLFSIAFGFQAGIADFAASESESAEKRIAARWKTRFCRSDLLSGVFLDSFLTNVYVHLCATFIKERSCKKRFSGC
jgi:hypothetical protein